MIGEQVRSPRTNYVRNIGELIINRQICDFFELYFGVDSHFDYYQDAMEAFFYSGIEPRSAQFGGYGFAEEKVEWLIIPQNITQIEFKNLLW